MNRHHSKIVLAILIVTTLAVYWQIGHHDFVNFDDNEYVSENPFVREGLTRTSAYWALTSSFHGHWHPLTWLSHMADCQFFGLDPGRHHLMSVLYHLASTLLLFITFHRMTGAVWRSAFVAALFALHPLHVEPVAWMAARKDVLSTLFWALAMLAYVRYSEKPGIFRYLLAFLVFVLGLTAKPMVVTLPFVFLLLDYWPLDRFRSSRPEGEPGAEREEARNIVIEKASLFRLLMEKALFFAAMGVSIIITISVMSYGKIMPILNLSAALPTKDHLAKALLHTIIYIGKAFWPSDLIIPYPKPLYLTIATAVTAGLILLGITFLVLWKGRRYPYLPVGWLWYLITIFPVSGIVKGGPAGMADRYTYLPVIGLFIIVAWGAPDLLAKGRFRRPALGAAAILTVSILALLTWKQVGHWKNSITLFKHSLAVAPDNFVAQNNLGVALMKEGNLHAASHFFSQAVRFNPKYASAHNNLGVVLKRQGRLEEAASHFSRVLEITPYHTLALNNLGIVLSLQGKDEEAKSRFEQALKLDPFYAEAHNNLGSILKKEGYFEEAMRHFSEAVRIKPDYGEAYNNIGVVLMKQGRLEEAMATFSEAVRITPDYAEAHNNLGVALERSGRLEEAMSHFVEALRIDPGYEKARKNLEVTLRRIDKPAEKPGTEPEKQEHAE